jgi:hypothetical protein
MATVHMFRRLIPGALAALTVLAVGGTAAATTRTYPGSAPCNTTLQACITGANAGDTIQILPTGGIDEDLTIAKSLTLTGDTAVIGGSATPRVLTVNDAGTGGGSVVVTVSHLTFTNATVTVGFGQASGHSFELSDSTITHELGTIETSGIDLSVSVPATVAILHNTISTSGFPVFIQTNTGGSGSIAVQGNTLTTSTPEFSVAGIILQLSGTQTSTVDVRENVIHSVGGCACRSSTSGIFLFSMGSVTATVNIVNNTIDDIQGSGDGILIPAPFLSGTQVTANVFNNLLTHATGRGINVTGTQPFLTVNNDFNDTFGNTSADAFGGYTAGPSTLHVDPQYTAMATGNYRLQVSSPVIDRGTDTPTGGLSATDADGNPRVAGATVDLGAYEHSAVATTTSTSTTISTSTTSTSSSTTSTIAPGCSPGATFDAVLCRLGALGAAVQTGVPSVPLRSALLALVARATTATQHAQAASPGRARKQAVRKALVPLAALSHRCRSRKVQKLLGPAAQMFVGQAEALKNNLKTLRTS